MFFDVRSTRVSSQAWGNGRGRAQRVSSLWGNGQTAPKGSVYLGNGRGRAQWEKNHMLMHIEVRVFNYDSGSMYLRTLACRKNQSIDNRFDLVFVHQL